jgi:RNA polymerase sigma-70 factor, ECF subfamily
VRRPRRAQTTGSALWTALPSLVLARAARAWDALVAESARRVSEDKDKGEPAEEADRTLLKRLAAGDEAALESLFLTHAGALHRIAYRYLHSSWAARAVVQDVFTAVWWRRSTLVVRGPIGAYLTVAVRNRARTVLREELRRRERDARWIDDSGKPESESSKRAAAAGEAAGTRARFGPRDLANARAAVQAALAALPDRQRTVFRLRVEEQMSNAEVRAAIGAVSVKAVERIFSRAVRTLRARLLPPDSGRSQPKGRGR